MIETEPYVYIVDDDDASRGSLKAIVEAMKVNVCEFDSAESFLSSLPPHRPACLITDQRMPGMGGLQLIEKLREQKINISIIVLTAYPDTRSTVRAMQYRAQTLLEKPCNPQELWDAIQQGLTIDAENFLHETEVEQTKKKIAALTPGEIDVFALLMDGLANKVIANRLGISLRTVEGRRANIFDKLGVNSIPELTAIWLKAAED